MQGLPSGREYRSHCKCERFPRENSNSTSRILFIKDVRPSTLYKINSPRATNLGALNTVYTIQQTLREPANLKIEHLRNILDTFFLLCIIFVSILIPFYFPQSPCPPSILINTRDDLKRKYRKGPKNRVTKTGSSYSGSYISQT